MFREQELDAGGRGAEPPAEDGPEGQRDSQAGEGATQTQGRGDWWIDE